MDRLATCRICSNANMSHLIPDTQMQEMYENLTSMPFQNTTKSSFMCYMCSAQLYNVHRLKLQCLKAEELLTQTHSPLLANRDGAQQESTEIGGTEIIPFTCTAVRHIDIEPFPIANDTIDFKYEVDIIDAKIEIKKEIDIPESDDGHQASDHSDVDNEQTYFDSKDDDPLNCIKEDTERVTDYFVTREVKKEPIEWKEGADEVNISEDNANSIKATVTHSDGVKVEGVTDREEYYKHNELDKSESKYCQWNGVSEFQCNDEYNNSTRSENEIQLICEIDTKNYKSKRIHTGEAPYNCKTCDKRFTEKRYLKGHECIHTGERPYSCKICDKRFTEKRYLKRHEHIHTGEKPYSCKICDKRFTEIGSLITHERLHTGERPYSCKICDKSFTQIGHLKTHEHIHTGEKPYSCTICDKRFSEKRYIKRHERIHTDERPYTCKVCDKGFTEKRYLERHELIHSSEKPYSCKICEKRFTQIDTLKTHERLHTGERPYSCNVCDKSFTQISHLKTHAFIHTDERPYNCKICDKRFMEKRYLKRHECIHTGEKPYNCKICDKGFTEKRYLNRHEQIHTGERT